MESVDLKETAAIVDSSSHEEGGLTPQSAPLVRRRGKIFPSTRIHVSISEDGTHLEAAALRNMDEVSVHHIFLSTDDVDGGRGDEKEEEHEVWSGVGCCSGYIDPFSKCQAKHLFKSRHTRHLHLQGRKLMGLHLFPLISRAAGELWSSFVLLLSCLLFALSLTAVIISPEGYKASNGNIIKVVIAGIAVLFSIPNFIISVRGCHLLRGPYKACKSNQTHRYSRFDEDLDSRTAPPNRVSSMQRYWRLFRDVVYDMCRLYVAEFLIYFNLAFSILDCVRSINGYSDTDSLRKLRIAHLAFSALGFFLHAYVVRLATLSTTYHSAKKTSTFRSSQDSTTCCSERGRCMVVFLVIYILLDMVTQGFAFAAMWLKADCEDPHGSSVGTHVSGYTWAMLVVGALLFMLGSVTWSITAYVWIQEFFLHYMLGIIHKLKAATSTEEKSATLDRVLASVPEEDRRSDVGGCCRKLLFPLHTPRLILPSCLYFLTWLTFFVLIFLGADKDGDMVICSRDMETDSLFTTFSAIIIFGNVASNLMNLPVVLVGAIWSTIALVCLLLLLLLLVCFLLLLLAAGLPVLLVMFLVFCLCQDPVCD